MKLYRACQAHALPASSHDSARDLLVTAPHSFLHTCPAPRVVSGSPPPALDCAVRNIFSLSAEQAEAVSTVLGWRRFVDQFALAYRAPPLNLNHNAQYIAALANLTV